MERSPVQGHYHQSRKHRALLQIPSILPRLQTASSQRPAHRVNPAHGPHARRDVFPEDQSFDVGEAVPTLRSKPQQQSSERGVE